MHRENWDDLRYLIAVAETGTVSGAARRLGVTHGTVLRRVAAFEDRHGTRVFEKSASGYALLPEFSDLLDAAHEVETAVMGIERALGRGTGGVRGLVRLTSTDSLCQTVLPLAVSSVTSAHPDLSVTLVSTNAHLDLGRAGLDITIRPSATPPDGLHSVQVGVLGVAVYAAPGAADCWLSLEGPLTRSLPAIWMADNLSTSLLGPGSDSFQALASMTELGLGRCFLPCVVASTRPTLIRQEADAPEFAIPLWLACQPDLADSPRIRAVMRTLQGALAPLGDQLAGTRSPRASVSSPSAH